MVFSNAEKDLKMIIVNCDCGCDEELHLKKYTYDDNTSDYYITLCESKFSSKQNGLFRTICNRFKSIFRILRGKEYLLCDINIKEKNIDDLIEKLKELKSNERKSI